MRFSRYIMNYQATSLCHQPQPSDLSIENSWYHAQPHPSIACYRFLKSHAVWRIRQIMTLQETSSSSAWMNQTCTSRTNQSLSTNQTKTRSTSAALRRERWSIVQNAGRPCRSGLRKLGRHVAIALHLSFISNVNWSAKPFSATLWAFFFTWVSFTLLWSSGREFFSFSWFFLRQIFLCSASFWLRVTAFNVFLSIALFRLLGDEYARSWDDRHVSLFWP